MSTLFIPRYLMLETFNQIVATEDPEVFRYFHIMKALNIRSRSLPYMGDGELAGYEIQLSLIVKGVPYLVSERIPIGSFFGVRDESVIIEYADCLYSGMISKLFDAVTKQ
ncbi:hypothetical protein PHYNN_117 [Pantoea phage Phynn]|nr:hypothetical protein PHYNN_117 [Pantoea phage Phynn]